MVEPLGWSESIAARMRSGSRGGGGLEHDAGVRAVLDDGDAVARPEPVDEDGQGLLHEAEAVLAGHRARGVDDERERGVRALDAGDLAGLDADAEEHLVGAEERARAAVAGDRERAVGRRVVVLVEGVHELLDPHGCRVREVAVADVALRDRVGGGVDVEGEGRLAVALRGDVRVHARVLELDAVIGRRRRLLRLVRVKRRLRLLVVGRRHRRAGVERAAGAARAGRGPDGDDREEQDRLAHGATSLGDRRFTRRSGSEAGRLPHEVPERRRMAAGRAGGDGDEEPCRRGHRVARGDAAGTRRSPRCRCGIPRNVIGPAGRWSIGDRGAHHRRAMSSATLDRLLALLVAALAATGLASLLAGSPDLAWLFVAPRRPGGGARRHGRAEARPQHPARRAGRRWERLALALVLSIAVVASLAAGFAWVAGARPVWVDLGVVDWTLLTLHAWLGLALVPLVLVHLVRARWRILRPGRDAPRRAADGSAPGGPSSSVAGSSRRAWGSRRSRPASIGSAAACAGSPGRAGSRPAALRSRRRSSASRRRRSTSRGGGCGSTAR